LQTARTGESKSSIQTGADENGQIILGEIADGLFLADKSGRFAFTQKKQGLQERFRMLDFKPNFFLDFDFPELNGSQKTSVAQKLFAFYASGGIYFAGARNGEIIGYAELSESPTAGFLLDQKNFVVGDEKGNLFSFTFGNNGKWRRVWSVKVGGSISGLTPVDDNLLVTSFDNFVYFLDRSNGRKIWKRRLSGRLVFKPLIAKKENRLIAVENNVAYLISLVDGKVSNQISLSPDEYFIGEPVSANNRYIFQTNERIISFSDSDKGCS
jgi:outer membrane protein assembly factor BamB